MPPEIKSPLKSTINWSALATAAAGWLASPEFQNVLPPKYLPFILSALSIFQLVRRNFFPNPPTTQIAAEKVEK